LVYNALVWKLTDICLCAEDYKLSAIIWNLICKYEINSHFYRVLRSVVSEFSKLRTM